jgi:uncharacterized membrane protein
MKRTLTKSITYTITITSFDFIAFYLLNSHVEVALGFTVLSNIYACVAYYLHKKSWDNKKLINKRTGEMTGLEPN